MTDQERHRTEEDQAEERGGLPGASAAESGGLYAEEGATLGDVEGRQVGDEEEEPERPEDRPGVGDVYRGGT